MVLQCLCMLALACMCVCVSTEFHEILYCTFVLHIYVE
jgi:hypothetical protein